MKSQLKQKYVLSSQNGTKSVQLQSRKITFENYKQLYM